MRVYDQGAFFQVAVPVGDVSDFNRGWPCSNIPVKAIAFTFDSRNGDLVDIEPDSSSFDGDALVALSHDAQEYGEGKLRAKKKHQ
jgi:hypothetical protein